MYTTAKQRAEEHANEGWSSESMQSRLLIENQELKVALVEQNRRANEMYSELEQRLQENDNARKIEIAKALKEAHEAKAKTFLLEFK